MTPLRTRLDDATADRRLLDHPFYKAWAAGTLTTEDLAHYAGQYWRQVEAFPSYLETIASRLPEGPTRAAVLANLGDERDDDHPGLWLDFAAALGSKRDAVEATPADPETQACVDAFTTACSEASPEFALGMLYGYESQTPAVAETKVVGLKEHYGIDGKGLTYFELHGELDVQHSAEMAEAIEALGGNSHDAAAGARAGAAAIWDLLDGVVRARGIC